MQPALAPLPEGISDDAWFAASRTIRDYCRWHIAPEISETLTLDGNGSSLLRLPSAYVVDVASVSNDGVLVATDGYEWSRFGMLRAVGRPWSRRFRGVVVELTHGYETCPEDVLEVAIQLARANAVLTSQSGSMLALATGMTSGPHSFQISQAAQAGVVGLSGQHRGVLNRYRLSSSP